jgi:hypothetical protein
VVRNKVLKTLRDRFLLSSSFFAPNKPTSAWIDDANVGKLHYVISINVHFSFIYRALLLPKKKSTAYDIDNTIIRPNISIEGVAFELILALDIH